MLADACFEALALRETGIEGVENGDTTAGSALGRVAAGGRAHAARKSDGVGVASRAVATRHGPRPGDAIAQRVGTRRDRSDLAGIARAAALLGKTCADSDVVLGSVEPIAAVGGITGPMRKAGIAETAMSAIAGVAVLRALGEGPRIGRCSSITERPQDLAPARLVARKCGEKGEASALLAAVPSRSTPRKWNPATLRDSWQPGQVRSSSRRSSAAGDFAFSVVEKSRFDRSVSRRTVENGRFFPRLMPRGVTETTRRALSSSGRTMVASSIAGRLFAALTHSSSLRKRGVPRRTRATSSVFSSGAGVSPPAPSSAKARNKYSA